MKNLLKELKREKKISNNNFKLGLVFLFENKNTRKVNEKLVLQLQRCRKSPKTMNIISVNKTSVDEITKELTKCVLDYDLLCLTRTQKWCAELLFAVSDAASSATLMGDYSRSASIQLDAKDFARFQLARAYFTQKEYQRAAFYLQDYHSDCGYFLAVYAKYMVRLEI